ncbi:MAG: protein kinase domain-containing protein [Planctomycetota bacterium]
MSTASVEANGEESGSAAAEQERVSSWDELPAAEPLAVGNRSGSGSHRSYFPETTTRRSKNDLEGMPSGLETTSHRAFTIDSSYANLGELARGNMGAIIRGRDRDLERDVALKVMLERNTSPQARMRFLQEAQITGQLEHPNIVPIHSLGTDTHGNPVFSMKLVRGITLDQIIEDIIRRRRKTLRDWPLERLVQTLIPACNAVEFAHSKGVIHRDLKPSNIMLGDFGEVLVMDWGLAKTGVFTNTETRRLQAPLHRIMAERRERLKGLPARREDGTVDGAIIGTPKYMSPEQAMGQSEVDARSDVYALGAILYDTLALMPPITGATVDEILDRVVAGRIVPPERAAPRREIPKELSAIACKALAREPRERYQNVAALREDLERYLAHRSVSAKEDTGWERLAKLVRRNSGSAGVAAAAVLLVAILLIVFMMAQRNERDRAQQTLAKLQAEHRAHQEQLADLAPALLVAARGALADLDIAAARTFAATAAEHDPDLIAAQRQIARIAIIRGAYVEASQALERARQLGDEDPLLERTLSACRRARTAPPEAYHNEFSAIFAKEGATTCASVLDVLLEERFAQARERLRVELPDARLILDDRQRWILHTHRLMDPLPLGGLPLSELICEDASVFHSLEILRGMPLQRLELRGAVELFDLEALADTHLESLHIDGAGRLQDLQPLRSLPLRELHIADADLLQDLAPLAYLPLRDLDLIRCQAVADFGPLAGLELRRCAIHHNEHLQDLSIFRDMPLRQLGLVGCTAITDLSPLARLPLTDLKLSWSTGIRDLAPLSQLPLRELHLVGCSGIRDLRPLADLELHVLYFSPGFIQQGLDAIKRMDSINQIGTSSAQIRSPGYFWRQLAEEDSGRPAARR